MATFISLNHYDLVEVAGVDAEKYLQGQLTCDAFSSWRFNAYRSLRS